MRESLSRLHRASDQDTFGGCCRPVATVSLAHCHVAERGNAQSMGTGVEPLWDAQVDHLNKRGEVHYEVDLPFGCIRKHHRCQFEDAASMLAFACTRGLPERFDDPPKP